MGRAVPISYERGGPPASRSPEDLRPRGVLAGFPYVNMQPASSIVKSAVRLAKGATSAFPADVAIIAVAVVPANSGVPDGHASQGTIACSCKATSGSGRSAWRCQATLLRRCGRWDMPSGAFAVLLDGVVFWKCGRRLAGWPPRRLLGELWRRGGSFWGEPEDLRSALRFPEPATLRTVLLGFRVARTLDD